MPALLIGTVSLLLFLSTPIRAAFVAKKLKNDMQHDGAGANLSFSYISLFTPFKVNTRHVEFEDFTYKVFDDRELRMKFYRSRVKGRRPCVIVIHGGSWKSGNNKQLPELNSLVASEGYHVAAINYRLAPKYRNPSAAQDVKDALIYLKANADRFNIDTGNFVLLGRSAGAQIALLAAYTLKDPGVKAVIDFYGPADMLWGYSVPAKPLVMDSRKVMEDYLGGTFRDVPQNYRLSSPLLFVDKNSVPTLIIHGKNDPLVAYEHSRRLYKKLRENKVYTYLLTLPWATHGFDYNINGPGGLLSTYSVITFLKKVCKKNG